MAKLSPRRRNRIKTRVEQLAGEEMTMRDLRKARHLTQRAIAKRLKINQNNVFRLEARSDVLISTLQAYVLSLGGELRLMAEFPDRPPVVLTGIVALENDKV